MKRRLSSIFITLFVTISCFLSVAYVSCSKSSKNAASCDDLNCLHGGVCQKGTCLCPNGYQGKNCEIAYNNKFVGTWKVHETVTSADLSGINKDSLYTVTITAGVKSTGGLMSPTAVLINNFLGNPNFTVDCVTDSTTNGFYVSPKNQIINGGALQVYSGQAAIDATHNTITGGYIRLHLGSPVTIYDTLTFTMSKQ